VVFAVSQRFATIAALSLAAVLDHVIIEGAKGSKAPVADRALICPVVVFVFVAEHGKVLIRGRSPAFDGCHHNAACRS
jgi:hypothetical protein